MASAKHAVESRKRIPADRKKIIGAIFLALLACTLVYSIATADGPSNFGDDLAYSWYAHAASQGRFMQNTFDVLSIRIMQIYPIGFFYLFGVSLVTSSAWDICSFIGTMIVIFFIGRELYNEYAGLLAALLFAFMPVILKISGTMSDSIPVMFLTSVAMLSLLYGQRLKSRKWYLITGIALVAAFLVMPEGLFAWAIVALYLFAKFVSNRFRVRKNEQYIAYGMAIALILLFAFNYFTAGKPFITFSFTFSYFQTHTYSYFSPANGNLAFYPNEIFPYHIISTVWNSISTKNISGILAIWNPSDVTFNSAGLYFYVAMLAILLLAVRREKRAYFVLFWFIIGLLIMEFDPYHVSISPFSYILQQRLGRYLTLIAPATVLIISIAAMHTIDSAKTKKMKRIAIAIVAIVFLLLIINAIPIDRLWQSLQLNERYSQFQIAQYLKTLPNSTRIYYMSGQSIPVYMGFNNQSRFIVYDQLDNCSQILPDSYIALPLYAKIGSTTYTPVSANTLCPRWVPALPYTAMNFSPQVESAGSFAQTQLYYIPPNGIAH